MSESRLVEEEAARSRGERTAERLREAARQAFAELGWRATRVEDIVQRAGVSHGTFYTYYDNKAAILSALVEDSEAAFAALAAAPWEADDVRGALERVIGGFLERYRADAMVMRTWLQAARDERGFTRLYVDSRALFVDRVADHVAAAVAASGREAVPHPQTLASSLVAMVEHFAYCWLVLGEDHDADEAVGSLVLVWGATLNALTGFEVVKLS
ncbi:MAG TPA: helix-turn-helix domain-containing protein [Egibacteraceae bacterium]|nr:helix-turn-helix domain-containing protein [Egibacteraceae bacterium]